MATKHQPTVTLMIDRALENALRATEELLRATGKSSSLYREKLLSEFSSLDESQQQSLSHLVVLLEDGFYRCAATGHAFVPPTRIREQFGRTLKENYAEASETFLRFATTYWTFKILHGDMFTKHKGKAVFQVLGAVEMGIASVFFPTPGPIVVPASQREQEMRVRLEGFEAPIDIDDFIRANPILIRSRSKGCLGLVLVGLGFLSAITFLVILAFGRG